MNEPVPNDDFSVEIPSDLPWQVSLKELDRTSGKLCSEQDFSRFKNRVELRTGYHSKKKNNLSRTILRAINKDDIQKSYAVHPRPLGKGSFGKVKLVQDQHSKKWFALKVIQTKKSKKLIKRVNKEISALKKNGHFEASYADIEGEKIYIVMGLAKGSSLDKLETKILPANRLFSISKNYLSAAHTLLKKGWRHHDHKLPNAILENGNNVRLVDLGNAQNTKKKNKKKNLSGTTIEHLAPEVLHHFLLKRKQENVPAILPFNEKTEVYALGLALAKLYSLTTTSANAYNTIGQMSANFNPRETTFEKLTRLVIKDENEIQTLQIPGLNETQKIKTWNFLKSMTAQNPDHRPTLKESMRFFEECENECLEVLGKFQTVGIVYLSELIKDEQALTSFSEPLRQFSKVYLINDVSELIETHKITGKFQEEAVTIAGIITPLKNNPAHFQNVVSYLEKNKKETVINTYIPVSAKETFENNIKFLKINPFVNCNISANTYRSEIRKIHAQENINTLELHLIIKALITAQDRVRHTSPEKTSEIQNVLDKLNDSENKSILKKGIVLNMLETLQNKMTHTSTIERYLEKKLGFWRDSTSKKNIKDIATAVRKIPLSASAA